MKDRYLGLKNLDEMKDSEWGRENARFVELAFEIRTLDMRKDRVKWWKCMDEMFELAKDEEPLDFPERIPAPTQFFEEPQKLAATQ
ncbi:MAG: hypothetical protein FWG65_12515 [Turicibacter sp.]|nr:hypothetical protein [Turicibacter sp.]